MKVEHCGQIIPTTRGPDVGNIATPHLIGLLDINFMGQLIGNIRPFRAGNLIAMSARLLGCLPYFLHQTAHLESANLIPHVPHR